MARGRLGGFFLVDRGAGLGGGRQIHFFHRKYKTARGKRKRKGR